MRGYVCFTVSGRYPERFLNITARQGIRLWKVERRGDGFRACMYRSDYRSIRSSARKSGVRLQVCEKSGLPQLAFRYRRRAGLVAGGCAFVVTVFLMSLFVWSVQITGLDTLSEVQIRSILREKGLYVGAFKPAIDAVSLADEVMIENREIGWMAVNLSGSLASVEVKEEAPAPEVEDIETPCNIKAKCDGLILNMKTAEGTAAVREGSAVIRGQLLVSGVMENADGGSRLVHASSKVLARVKHEASFSVPERLSVMLPSGEIAERLSAELFGIRIPYYVNGVGSPYSVTREYTEAPVPMGVQLPVGRVRERVSALESVELQLDENSAKELLERQAMLYEVFNLADYTVEERASAITCRDGSFTLNMTYTCEGDIGMESPIGVGEVY